MSKNMYFLFFIIGSIATFCNVLQFFITPEQRAGYLALSTITGLFTAMFYMFWKEPHAN